MNVIRTMSKPKSKLKQKGDNVQVVIRCRPQNKRELRKKESTIVSTNPLQSEITVQAAHRNNRDDGKRKFTFDHVFGPTSTQLELYDAVVKPVVAEVLQGFNCTVFAYGQTGTGKTHTMEGNIQEENMKGIIPRSVEDIFQRLGAITCDSSVKISFMELYNENLEDLLIEENTGARLKLAETPRGVVVQNLENLHVNTAADIYKHLESALAKRKVSATKMNKQSSRSHSVFTITIRIKETNADGEDLIKVGKLNLVDLAGSECVGRSGAQGDRKREAGNINQSLLTLGRVISALVEHRPHIPYRDSKLTRILRESLGGKAKTTIIATVTPSSSGFEETCSTLKYANTAKSIENKPEVNQRMTKRALLKDYEVDMHRMKDMLAAARAKDGVYLPTERYDELMANEISNKLAVKEAENTLERKVIELQETMKTLNISQEELHKTQEDLLQTKETLVDAEIILDVREASLNTIGNKANDAFKEGNHASSDVHRLHAKNERKNMLAHSNVNITNHLKIQTKSSIATLLEHLQEAQSSRNAQNQTMTQALQTALERQETECNAIHATLSLLQKKCASDSKLLNTELDTHAQSLIATTAHSAEMLSSNVAILTDAFNKQKNETQNILQAHSIQLEKSTRSIETFISNTIAKAASTFQKQMTTLASKESKRQDTIILELRTKLSTVENELEKTRSEASSALNSSHVTYGQKHDATMSEMETKLSNAVNQIETCDATLKQQSNAHHVMECEEMETMKTKMMEMFANFETSQQKRKEEKIASFFSLTHQIATDVAKTKDELLKKAKAEKNYVANEIVLTSDATLSQISTTSIQITQDMQSSMEKNINFSKEQWMKMDTTSQEWCENTKANGIDFVNEMQTETKETKQNIQQRTELCQENDKETLSKMNQLTTNGTKNDEEMNSLISYMSSTMNETNANHLKTMTSSVTDAMSSLHHVSETVTNDIQTTMASMETSIKQDELRNDSLVSTSTKVNTMISDHSMEIYAPTGTTPAKREYNFPSPVQKMAPRAVVLSRAKGIDEDGGEVEGESDGEQNNQDNQVEQEQETEKNESMEKIESFSDSSETLSETSSETLSETSPTAETEILSETDSSPIAIDEIDIGIENKKDEEDEEEEEIIVEPVVVEKKTRARSRRGSKRSSGIPRAKRSLGGPSRRTLAEKN